MKTTVIVDVRLEPLDLDSDVALKNDARIRGKSDGLDKYISASTEAPIVWDPDQEFSDARDPKYLAALQARVPDLDRKVINDLRAGLADLGLPHGAEPRFYAEDCELCIPCGKNCHEIIGIVLLEVRSDRVTPLVFRTMSNDAAVRYAVRVAYKFILGKA